MTEIAAEDLLVKALQATSVTSSFRKQTGVNLVVDPVIKLHLSPVTAERCPRLVASPSLGITQHLLLHGEQSGSYRFKSGTASPSES